QLQVVLAELLPVLLMLFGILAWIRTCNVKHILRGVRDRWTYVKLRTVEAFQHHCRVGKSPIRTPLSAVHTKVCLAGHTAALADHRVRFSRIQHTVACRENTEVPKVRVNRLLVAKTVARRMFHPHHRRVGPSYRKRSSLRRAVPLHIAPVLFLRLSVLAVLLQYLSIVPQRF